MIGRPRTVRARAGIAMAALMLGLSWAGCSGDFVPPPPTRGESADSVGPAPSPTGKAADARPMLPDSTSTVRRIDVILNAGLNPYIGEFERIAARTQAGYEHARLHFFPDDGNSPGARGKGQPQIVRDSIAAKASAIIIDPDDPADKELAAAIREARAARIPVVILGHPFTADTDPKAQGAAPMVLVAPQPFAVSAKRLVELTIRNARNSRLDPKGGAIILHSNPTDRLDADRAGAIRKALEDAGIPAIKDATVPIDIPAGVARLKEVLEQNPRVTMVFFLDMNGATVSNDTVGKVRGQFPYVQGGYATDESRTRSVLSGQYAGIADYDDKRLIRRAVTVAVAAAHGRESKAKEELSIPIIESPAGAGLPAVENSGPPRPKEAAGAQEGGEPGKAGEGKK